MIEGFYSNQGLHYINDWCSITSLDQRIMKLVYQYAFSQPYSHKGLSSYEKLIKQTKFAIIAGKKYVKKGISQSNNKYIVDPNLPFCFKMWDSGWVSIFEKHSYLEKCQNYAVFKMNGSRSKMEDSYCVKAFFIQKQNCKLYCVFDGHKDGGLAGKFIAQFLPIELITYLETKELNHENIADALTHAFVNISEQYYKFYGKKADGTKGGGTTAVCLFNIGEHFYFPNVGDSRVILVNPETSKFKQLSEDANISEERFQKYHKNRNHEFFDDAVFDPETYGQLRMSGVRMARDIGNFYLCSRPKISYLNKPTGYLIFATDGLWDVATSREVTKCVLKMVQKKCTIEEMAMNLAQSARESSKALNPSTGAIEDYSDNILVMIVQI